MKRVFNKTVLESSLFISLTAVQAQANSNYICLGIDEAPGFATVDAGREEAGKVFGHAQGYELRLLENDGMLSLTIKKSNSDIISIVGHSARGILFSQGTVSVNCVKQEP